MKRFESTEEYKEEIIEFCRSVTTRVNVLWEMSSPFGELYYTIEHFMNTMREIGAAIDLENMIEILESAERRWYEVLRVMEEEVPGLCPEGLGITKGLSAIRQRLR